MRRLSVIDVQGGQQPISNEDGTVQIVFNGEIYNHHVLRAELERKGHRFSTQSDTEVIVHLYEEYGRECVQHLDGMFAFAIWDERTDIQGLPGGRLFIARDRLGKKPLYYADTGGAFIFASEPKAILCDKRVGRTIDLQSLHDYLSLGMVPCDRSIYKEIRKLLPGHTLLITTEGVVETHRYWKLSRSHGDGIEVRDARTAVAEVKRLLFRAVEKRLESEVPLGAFLSGGLDSSLVTAIMARLCSRSIQAFSIGFEGPESHNELPLARIAARHLGVYHHEFLARPDIVNLLPEIIDATDEPFAISSAIPLLLLSREARQEVTVVLTGDGGDEVLGGYSHYLYERWAQSARRLPSQVTRLVGAAANVAPQPVTNPIGAMQKRIRHLIGNSGGTAADRRLGWSSWFSEAEKQSLYSTSFSTELAASGVVPTGSHLQTLVPDALSDPVDTANYLDAVVWLPDEMLTKVDRMTMQASLEARCPLLDIDLVNYCARLSFDTKIPGNRDRDLKSLLRSIAEEFLPRELTVRRKHGFNVPLDAWFRGSARAYLEHSLSRERINRRGFFNPDTIEDLLATHQSGKANLSNRLYGLLTFEIWADKEL
jgi:asparagine synthase (glutamine-hydrolysing)